jgi:hypothetical protein
MRKRWIFIAPAAIAAFVLFIAAGGTVVRLLWNWLLPPLFGWREITFWQALAILALCRLLFGGFGRHGSGSGRTMIRRRIADRLADRIDARWDQMSPEDRDHFRQRMRERCGFGPSTSGGESKTL